MATHKNYSEATAVEIDTEIRRIVDQNYTRVIRLLSDHVELLHRLSKELIEKENLTGEEVERIVKAVVPPEAPVEAAPEAPVEAVPES
jgi:cell division protease FtsH